MSTYKHGHAPDGKPSREYRSWLSMKQRCLNPNYPQRETYAGRGITICERWMQFENFLADMGPRPPGMTLDRYPDQAGNYEPGNCRWATPKEQAANRRLPRLRKPQVNNKSGHVGVFLASDGRNWEARYSRKYLGTFATLDAAVAARKAAEPVR